MERSWQAPEAFAFRQLLEVLLVLEPLFVLARAVERKSRRARKNRQPLKVCSSDSLAQLRLKVFEALSVHPKNQQLYMRGSLLQGEESTLAQVRAARAVLRLFRGSLGWLSYCIVELSTRLCHIRVLRLC
jgi:hypothetical protein